MFHKHQIFLLQCLCNLTSVNGAFTNVQADDAKSPSVIKVPYFGPSHIGLEFDWWLLGNHRSLEKNKWFLPVVVKSVAKTTRDWSLSPLQLLITWEKCVHLANGCLLLLSKIGYKAVIMQLLSLRPGCFNHPKLVCKIMTYLQTLTNYSLCWNFKECNTNWEKTLFTFKIKALSLVVR